MTTRAAILKALNDDRISLEVGEDCFYFLFSESGYGYYMDRCVYVSRLNHLSLEQWVEEGKAFIASIDD